MDDPDRAAFPLKLQNVSFPSLPSARGMVVRPCFFDTWIGDTAFKSAFFTRKRSRRYPQAARGFIVTGTGNIHCAFLFLRVRLVFMRWMALQVLPGA
jgi:hypothetical protein